ncbi:MAG: hypothetical protein LC105_04245 [Chitinophagales bacterium]|nr:hypothetical protein [Chitinophagales bacterium]
MEKLSQEEINQLKAKHGALHLLEVEDKWAILKNPSRKTLSYASSVASKDPIKFGEILLKDCMVAGDDEIQNEDAYFLAASAKVAELIKVKEATLVKL